MEKIIRACGLLLAMAVVVVLNSCFDSSVECIGCNGRGVFTFEDVSVQCKYCHGTGTITKELANYNGALANVTVPVSSRNCTSWLS